MIVKFPTIEVLVLEGYYLVVFMMYKSNQYLNIILGFTQEKDHINVTNAKISYDDSYREKTI